MAVRQPSLMVSCCCECRFMTADVCFIVVSCMGYLTGKMLDHTDEICIEDMPTITMASSNFGCPWNFFIQLFPNWTACSPITYTNLTLLP